MLPRESFSDTEQCEEKESHLAPVTYRSRVDLWFVFLLVLIYAGILYEGIVQENELAWVFGILFTLVLRLAALPCRYTLMPDHVLVRCGVQRWEIPYKEIKSMRSSYNPATAPALSLRRLEIRHGPQLTLISPPSPSEFASEVRARMRMQRHCH